MDNFNLIRTYRNGKVWVDELDKAGLDHAIKLLIADKRVASFSVTRIVNKKDDKSPLGLST
jgi:hypothetical protein